MATITFPAALRSGLIHTPSATVPAGHTSALLTVLLPVQADRDSTAASMTLSIDYSTNAGGTWKPYVQAGWHGGTGWTDKHGVTNPPPNIGLQADQLAALAGSLARATFDLSTTMTVGATVTLV